MDGVGSAFPSLAMAMPLHVPLSLPSSQVVNEDALLQAIKAVLTERNAGEELVVAPPVGGWVAGTSWLAGWHGFPGACKIDDLPQITPLGDCVAEIMLEMWGRCNV